MSNMKMGQKAVLLSCVVFPGVGHIYLNHYVRGLLFLSLTALPTIYFFVELSTHMIKVMAIAESPTTMDFVEHYKQVMTETLAIFKRNDMLLAKAIMLVLWGLATWDAYRLSEEKS